MNSGRTIDTIDDPTPADFQARYLETQQPVILRGVMDSWNAVKCWTIDYLKAASPNQHLDPPSTPKDYADVASDYLVTQVALTSKYPKLLADIQIPEVAEKKDTITPFLWCGVKGRASPLHYDSSDNLHALVTGKKRFLMYPPEQISRMYPRSVWSRSPNISRINMDDPDFNRFPLFKDATPVEFDLNGGEILFIPSAWWHHVLPLEDCIALTFAWQGTRADKSIFRLLPSHFVRRAWRARKIVRNQLRKLGV